MNCARNAMQTLTRTICLLLVFAGMLGDARAEIIDGAADLLDEPDGSIVGVLYDNTQVEMAPPYLEDKVWFPIAFAGYVDRSCFLPGTFKVKAKCKFFDKQGRAIGKTVENVKADWILGEESGRIGLVFEKLLVHRNSIRGSSIPEYELVDLLDGREGDVQKADLAGFLDRYEFRKWPVAQDRQIEDYYLSERGDDPSPVPRLELIFYKGTLVSVVHRRLLQSRKYYSHDLFRDLKRMDVAETDPEVMKRIQESIIDPLRSSD